MSSELVSSELGSSELVSSELVSSELVSSELVLVSYYLVVYFSHENGAMLNKINYQTTCNSNNDIITYCHHSRCRREQFLYLQLFPP